MAGRESINLTDGAAELLARLADGGMRDALSLLDQCSGRDIIDENTVLEATGSTGSLLTAGLLDAVAAHDVTRALSIFSELWRDGKDPAGVLSDLTGLMRDALLLSIAPKGADGLLSGMYDRETLRRFASMFTHEELLRNMSAAQAGVSALRDSPSARTTAELTLVTLCDGTLSGDTASLAARLSRVEAELSALRAGGLRAAPVQAPAAEPEPAPAACTPAPEPAVTISEGPSGAPRMTTSRPGATMTRLPRRTTATHLLSRTIFRSVPPPLPRPPHPSRRRASPRTLLLPRRAAAPARRRAVLTGSAS